MLRNRTRSLAQLVWIGAVVGVLAGGQGISTEAWATQVTLRSRTVYHGYQIRLAADPSFEGVRNLNRFYETLDGGLYAFGPSDQLDVVMSLRYDTDFGTGFHPDTADGLGIPRVDGRDDVDLMYLYVDWRDVIDGYLDLRLGRQLILDDLDWYSLDGLKLTGHLFRGAYVEAYVGVPVRYDVFSSSEALINDGTQVSDGVGLAFGAAAFFRLFEDLSLSAAYRQELLFREDDIQILNGEDGYSDEVVELLRSASGGSIGLQESLMGFSAGYSVRPINIDLYAKLTWNLFVGALDQARAGIAYNPTSTIHGQVEYLRVRPRFAGDSIFNFFNIFPYDRLRAEATLEPFEGFVVEGGYFLQQVGGGPKGAPSDVTPGGEGDEFSGSDLTHGPSVGVSYARGFYRVGVFGEATTNTGGELAFGGNYRRADVFGDFQILEEKLAASLRFNYTGFQNDWFETLDPEGIVQDEQQSYSIDIGVRSQITDYIWARFNFIKNFQSVLEGSYRLYSALTVQY